MESLTRKDSLLTDQAKKTEDQHLMTEKTDDTQAASVLPANDDSKDQLNSLDNKASEDIKSKDQDSDLEEEKNEKADVNIVLDEIKEFEKSQELSK